MARSTTVSLFTHIMISGIKTEPDPKNGIFFKRNPGYILERPWCIVFVAGEVSFDICNIDDCA